MLPLAAGTALSQALYHMNRNKRKVKKANHGARPNNSVGRKARRNKKMSTAGKA